MRFTTAASIALLCCTSVAGAQAKAPVTVNGVAYDSLRHMPLADALITLSGGTRTTMTDRHGYFRFDSVAPGKYTVVMMHDILDSVGISGVATRATVSDGRDTVSLAVPSYATLWSGACHSPAPGDSGFVFGVVSTADHTPAGNALVRATWLDVGYDTTKGVTGKQWTLEIGADASGSYSLCGIPTSAGIRIGATTDSASSGFVDLLPADLRVARRDLVLSPRDSAARGMIGGVVMGDGGRLLSSAHVIVDGSLEAQTGPDGRFILRKVPAGTRQLEIRAIGLTPETRIVEVIADELVSLVVDLSKVTVLDSVQITASAGRDRMIADLAERKKLGAGQYRDSTAIGNHPSMESVFREMPSVDVKIVRGDPRPSATRLLLPGTGKDPKCVANLFIDGVRADQEELAFLYTDQIGAIELYARMLASPPEFVVRQAHSICGTVMIWTKRYIGR